MIQSSCQDTSSGSYCTYLGMSIVPSLINSGDQVTITSSFVPPTCTVCIVDSTLLWVFVTTPDNQVFEAGGYSDSFPTLYSSNGGGSLSLYYVCSSSSYDCRLEWYDVTGSSPTSLSSLCQSELRSASGGQPPAAACAGDTSTAGTYAVVACWVSSASNSAAFLTSTFNISSPDFSFGQLAPIALDVGWSGSNAVTANSIDSFSSPVDLSSTSNGFTTSFSSNPVTPASGGSASSTLTSSVEPFVTLGTYSLSLTGASTSPLVTHSTSVAVAVFSTSSSIAAVINQLLSTNCIVDSGIANSLTSKLSSAQTEINNGNDNAAENILSTLINEVEAQNNNQISSSCTTGGTTFNAASILISDATSLINSLKTGSAPNKISGSVVNSLGAGFADASVSLCTGCSCTGTNAVASTTTDTTGFYYFALTYVLDAGTYTVEVTGFPGGYSASTPYTFPWSGSAALSLPNLVVS